MFEERAKERQESGKKIDLKTNSSEGSKGASATQAAKAVNVGASIVKDAQFVRDHDPEAVRVGGLFVLLGCWGLASDYRVITF